MTTSVRIHGFAPSTYTRSTRIGAYECGIGHELVPLAFGQPEHFALHPFGKMPVLEDGEITVFETLAALAYLDMRYGGDKLFGAEPREKIAVLRGCSVAIDYAYRPLVHLEVTAHQPDPDDYAIATRVLDWLDLQASANTFVAGPALSAADIVFAPMLAYHLSKLGEDRTYASRPNLQRWMAEMVDRPSFAATKE